MNSVYRKILEELARSGWNVDILSHRRSLTGEVIARYPWMPADYREFIEEVNAAVNPEQTAWLLTVSDFSPVSDRLWAWNEWERQSLDAARNHRFGAVDHGWTRDIKDFWDHHLPILTSVKSCYAYWALEHPGSNVVLGEYEECTTLAPSIPEALNLITVQHPRIQWCV
jgi:hypothetical protein